MPSWKHDQDDQIKEDETVGKCETQKWGEIQWVLIGKLEEKRPLERPTHRQEDNIKIGIKKYGGI
jgi:hypothetical protein